MTRVATIVRAAESGATKPDVVNSPEGGDRG